MLQTIFFSFVITSQSGFIYHTLGLVPHFAILLLIGRYLCWHRRVKHKTFTKTDISLPRHRKFTKTGLVLLPPGGSTRNFSFSEFISALYLPLCVDTNSNPFSPMKYRKQVFRDWKDLIWPSLLAGVLSQRVLCCVNLGWNTSQGQVSRSRRTQLPYKNF